MIERPSKVWDWRSLTPLIILYGIMALPVVRDLFEAHPSSHMLLQIPLLALLGACVFRFIPHNYLRLWEKLDPNGIASLVTAAFCLVFWMIPRALDESINTAGYEIIKFTALPFLLGLPLRYAWPRIGSVLRGFAKAQFIAMLAYLGWLYSAAPIRICNNYLEGAQQQLGAHLLLLAFVLAVTVGVRPLFWGRPDAGGTENKNTKDIVNA